MGQCLANSVTLLKKGVAVGIYLSHLCFADDIKLLSDATELTGILQDLDKASKVVGLYMNLQTKIMSTNNIRITLNNTIIQNVNNVKYVYLDYNIELSRIRRRK